MAFIFWKLEVKPKILLEKTVLGRVRSLGALSSLFYSPVHSREVWSVLPELRGHRVGPSREQGLPPAAQPAFPQR